MPRFVQGTEVHVVQAVHRSGSQGEEFEEKTYCGLPVKFIYGQQHVKERIFIQFLEEPCEVCKAKYDEKYPGWQPLGLGDILALNEQLRAGRNLSLYQSKFLLDHYVALGNAGNEARNLFNQTPIDRARIEDARSFWDNWNRITGALSTHLSPFPANEWYRLDPKAWLDGQG